MLICLFGLTACQKQAAVTATDSNTAEGSQSAKPAEQATAQDSKQANNKASSPENNVAPGVVINKIMADLDRYVGLIGLSKQAAIDAMSEKPRACDEGGLRFEKANINIWFEDYDHTKQVEQICVLESKLDFNGTKFGDDINIFDKIFGKPDHDYKQKFSDSATRYYKYKNVFLSIGYDTTTNKTHSSFYILKKLYAESE